jgi:hypothetical protein
VHAVLMILLLKLLALSSSYIMVGERLLAHSCLVPINEMRMKVLYVFVDILIDLDHFIETFELNLDDVKSSKP